MYKEEYPDYIDPSLVKGLVGRYMRRVKELSLREPGHFAVDAGTKLELELNRGVPKKKRLRHFLRFMDEIKKIKPIIPVFMPNETSRNGFYLDLDIVERYGEPHLKFALKIVDYKRGSLVRFTVEAAAIDTNHVLIRWLEREQVKKINFALWMMGVAWLTAKDNLAESSFVGKASLQLPNGGMLLGEIDSIESTFLASTYISNEQVRPHNLESCINPNQKIVEDSSLFSNWEAYLDEFYDS